MKAKRRYHVSRTYSIDDPVPYIRISGKWLRDFGFDIGDRYEVDASFSRLVITNKENDTIDDCVIDEGEIGNNTNENSLENIVNNSPHSQYNKKDSYYKNGYRGYTINLKMERDINYKPVHLTSSQQAYYFLKSLQDETREVMLAVMLNRKNSVLGVYEAGKGGIAGSAVYPSEVFKPAFMTNSTAILLAHNHPSGAIEPSREDIKLTDDLNAASKILGMQLIDHIIIGYNKYYSFRDSGHLK